MSRKRNKKNSVDRFQFMTMDELNQSPETDFVIQMDEEDDSSLDEVDSDNSVEEEASVDNIDTRKDFSDASSQEDNAHEEDVYHDSDFSEDDKEEISSEEEVHDNIVAEEEDNDKVVTEEEIDEEKNSEESNEEKKIQVVKEDRDEELNKPKQKKHISFEVRIVIMIVCILCLFVGSCLLILETVRNSEQDIVSYKETSTIDYNVCMLANRRYNVSCLNENLEYDSELTDTINVHFKYDVQFSTDISYNMYYHVDAVTSFRDQNDSSKIVHQEKDTIKPKVALDDVNNYISFDANVVLDYQKYNDGAVYYRDRYFINSNVDVELILYLDEPNNSRKIASLTIPLGVPQFAIRKNVVSNVNGSVAIDGNFWNQYNAICALIASILIIVALFLLYRTTLLVLRVTSNRSEYQQRLDSILREYDRIIVIARGGYESNYVKEVVKLETFDELLEIRNELLKPIIYSRVNDVKSEFLVEDDEKLYKYVIKESDSFE